MFPHKSPTFLSSEDKVGPFRLSAWPWFLAAALSGVLCGSSGLSKLLSATYGWWWAPPLFFVAGAVPFVACGMLRPLGYDPLAAALILLRHKLTPKLALYRPSREPVPESAPAETRREGGSEW